MKELPLHIAILDFLRLSLPREALIFHIPNGEYRNKRTAARLKSMGVMPGMPDLAILYGGKFYGLEVKPAGKYLSPAQKQTHEAIKNAGCEVFTCHSIDEAALACDFWAIPLRAHTTTGNMTVMAMVS